MNILVTGAWNGAKTQLDTIRAMGHQVLFLQNESDELPCACSWVEGVICNGLFLHHPMEQFTALRYIQLTSAGFDRVPMEQVNSCGIDIYNARGVYGVPMAEFALCGVLQLYKQSRFFSEKQANRCWEKHRGLMELAGKTVCIVGCGSVGTECARRFEAFDCRVVGVDVFTQERPHFQQILPLEQLNEALAVADVVVLTLPLTTETRHLMNGTRFGKMKPGAVLVNIARGAVVDTDSLTEALRGNLGGAVLDVFEEEPLDPEHPLWSMENVLLTPHNSFVGDGNQARLCRVIMENLERYQ